MPIAARFGLVEFWTLTFRPKRACNNRPLVSASKALPFGCTLQLHAPSKNNLVTFGLFEDAFVWVYPSQNPRVPCCAPPRGLRWWFESLRPLQFFLRQALVVPVG